MANSSGQRAPKPGSGYGAFTGIAASALLVLALIVVTQLEFYEWERWTGPSAEARSNSFYVLGKWLSESGHPARFSPGRTGIGDLSPQEGGLFIQASLFDWEHEDPRSWVREGGILVVSVDFPLYRNDKPAEEIPPQVLAMERFFDTLGISIRLPERENEDEGDSGDKWDKEESGFPVYDYNISFEPPAPAAGESLILRDPEGNIRLIRRALGKGQVTVAGACVFMYNYFLDQRANALLAWELTGGSLGPERPGILFVRGRRGSGGIGGILEDRGSMLPPVLSGLVLLITGFWVAFPGFGLPQREESRRRLSITGRFAAEARFLRRYGALGVYLEVYLRELRRRSGGRDLGQEVREAEEALGAGKKTGPRKMAACLKNLMSALERL